MPPSIQTQNFQMNNDKKGISIFCPLCKGYLINSITVHCGHVFCSFCLKQYLLYSSQCTQCYTEIRESETCYNITLDKLVTQYLSKHLPQDFQQYKKTIQLQKYYNKKRPVMNIYSGDYVDVLDKNRIWHKALVLSTTMKEVKQRRLKILRVKYQNSSIQQQIFENSNSIAPAGFFTDRQLIPKYHKGLTMVSNKGEHYLYQK